MPKRYRKKPVVIEAAKLQKGNESRVAEWCGGQTVNESVDGCASVEIETLEGTMTASPGDFIIKGVNGEFYPCKSDIFEKTYEIVEVQ